MSAPSIVLNWIKGNNPFFKEHNMSLLPNYILARNNKLWRYKSYLQDLKGWSFSYSKWDVVLWWLLGIHVSEIALIRTWKAKTDPRPVLLLWEALCTQRKSILQSLQAKIKLRADVAFCMCRSQLPHRKHHTYFSNDRIFVIYVTLRQWCELPKYVFINCSCEKICIQVILVEFFTSLFPPSFLALMQQKIVCTWFY